MDFLKPADINAGVEEFRATSWMCGSKTNMTAATFPAR